MVPRNPKTLPDLRSLRGWRSTALDRVEFWFPGRFSEDEMEAARAVEVVLLPAGAGRTPRLGDAP